MKSRSFFRFDLIIFFAAVGLSIIGILFIYSSGISSDGVLQNNEYIKQIVWASIGIVIMIVLSFFDYERLRSLSFYIYGANIILLLIVLFSGDVVNGARSWISIRGIGFQPSEFMKISLILRLGVYFEESRNKYSDFIRFLLGLIQAAIPMLLVIIQPDMGTALVYFPIFLTIAFVAGVKKRYLFFLLAAGFLTVMFSLIPAWDHYIITEKSVELTKVFTDPNLMMIVIGSLIFILVLSGIGLLLYKRKYFYWIGYAIIILIIACSLAMGTSSFIKDYQLKRLIIFIDPQIDPQGAGWNMIQSVTAVGSGGTFGKGFLKGTQSHYRYLPQQSTDFIFSIISEEWGFIGCLAVFLLFLIIMIRGLYILLTAKDEFALFVGCGIIGMIFFHFIVNIGMAMGIMPITGIPLLLVSYGGSSMFTTMIGLGLISSIYLHKYKY
ncbi:MAG: rod shape-determining protein RodA [Spirochaetales bacterium]|nr:rod shape-determining protein RodA [Spirochaetales bacterium]